ncbi:MAG: hypothetical protein M1817_001178 [Caeruleum heppii]|nr:MAG: hypothetical protein M1817_001178 [Caeruleum heppii]
MALTTAPTSSLPDMTPCPQVDDFHNKQKRRRSLLRLSSISSSTSTRTAPFRLSRSSSASYPKRISSGMKLSPVSFQTTSTSSRDFLIKRRGLTRSSSCFDGTVLRAVPASPQLQTSKDQSHRQSQQQSPGKSPTVRKRMTVVSPMSESPSDQVPPSDAVVSPSSNVPSPTETIVEVHPDFLGVWKDGTVHWAVEAETKPANAQRERNPPSTERESSAYQIPTVLEKKSRRPKIQVTIPESQRPSQPTETATTSSNDERRTASQAHSATSSKGLTHSRSHSSGSTTKPSSSTPRMAGAAPRPPNPSTMPRKAQGLGLESAEMVPELSVSSVSASSDEHFDDASSIYSATSSMSSLTIDPASKRGPVSRTGSVAYSICSPAFAGVFDEAVESSSMPSPRILRAMKGSTIALDTSNKPLPPEPLEMAPAPLSISGRHCSKPSMMKSGATMVASHSPRSSRSISPLTDSSSPMLKAMPHKTSRLTLKSKYSTTDLDAIDKAFQRSSPQLEITTLVEAEEALALQLSTISEDAPESGPFEWDDVPQAEGPLQIARGPMRMAPSRAAPPPPPAPTSKTLVKAKPNARLTKNNAFPQRKSSILEGAMTRDPQDNNGRGKWVMRAQKVLSRHHGGESRDSLFGGPTPVPHRTLPAVPILNPAGPAGEGGSLDPAVLEIHRRLELLKVKERSNAVRAEAFRLADERKEFQPPVPANMINRSRAPSVAVPTRDGKLVEAARRGRRESENIPSVISLTISEIPEWYASMPPSSGTAEEAEMAARAREERFISANDAEAVLFGILSSLTNLQDLFSAAVVSRGFYRTFKRHELAFMQGALMKMSPAAWELREMSPPFADGNDLDCDRPVPDYTPQTYLGRYTRDMYIMVALKSLILERCESFLRPETVAALAGQDDERSLQLDDAFWRVWTFCKIFGSNKSREDDLVGQMDWLRGGVIAHRDTCGSSVGAPDAALGLSDSLVNPPESFGIGNAQGLSPTQLWDMTEIWTCLGVLVHGFQGKREMAREYGIFDNQEVAEGDVNKESALLDEWVAYILTLGPSVILDLASPSDQTGPEGFALAAENGWTAWEAPSDGASRVGFLKTAVTRVYEEKMAALRIPERSHSRNVSASSRPAHSSSASANRLVPTAEARHIRCDSANAGILVDKDGALNGSATRLNVSVSDLPMGPGKQVDDPVDKAVRRMVGMGFPTDIAKKALAETDTGENLNVQAAIDLCLLWTNQHRPHLV